MEARLIAGHRESTRPGIGARAERYLAAVFAAIGHPAAKMEE